MKLIAYTRVSTQEQKHAGHSLDAQITRINDYCKAMDHVILAHFVDAASGKNTNRQGYQDALAALDSADGLIVVDLDRVTRSVRDFVFIIEEFARRNKTFIAIKQSVDLSTPSGKLMAHVLVSFAEYERSLMQDRIKAGIRARAEKGLPVGRPAQALPASLVSSITRAFLLGSSLRENAAEHGVSIAIVRRVIRDAKARNGVSLPSPKPLV